MPRAVRYSSVPDSSTVSVTSTLPGARELDPLGKAEAARIVDGVIRWRFAWDAEAPTVIGGPS
jgi:hypothetical protein